MWISQYVFIPEDVEEAVILPAGTTIGTVTLVSLATMNDPALVAVMEAAHEEAETILKQAADMRQKAESWKVEVYSIMAEEGMNAKAIRQTTVRHKPETALPKHDIRGTKSGSELVKIWEMSIKNNKGIRDQFNNWLTNGPGKLMQFGAKLEERELRETTETTRHQ